MLNQLVNIGDSAQWQKSTRITGCSKQISSWLLDTSSLTQKLEGNCQKFTVKVKKQDTTNNKETPLSHYFPYPEKIFVREVLLLCDGAEVVFAQTEIPYSTLTESQQKLMDIGEQSLGKILFQDKSMQRDSIEIAKFATDSQIHKLSGQLGQSCDHPLWARRSLFYINKKPLLVSEIFLPASGIYQ